MRYTFPFFIFPYPIPFCFPARYAAFLFFSTSGAGVAVGAAQEKKREEAYDKVSQAMAPLWGLVFLSQKVFPKAEPALPEAVSEDRQESPHHWSALPSLVSMPNIPAQITGSALFPAMLFYDK